MAYTTIKDPSAYFQTKLYTGGTVGAKTFDGNSNLKPDLFWSKKRGAVQSHYIADSVRGTTYAISSNTTAASYTDSETDDLASFDTNGFTFSGIGDTYNGTYQSDSYVAWGWSAAGNSGSANTDGSISSTVSANTTSGFSIVSYTGNGSSGATVGHGLGVTPKMIIVKRLAGGSTNWGIYHEAMGNTATLFFTTGAKDTDVSYWNNTSPTSSVFTLGSSTLGNAANTYIAYCFSEVKGYSKFGSYVGNGSTDGTFVYTGFKPAFVMIKCSSSGGSYTSWSMFDTTRQTFNVNAGKTLYANLNSAEGVRGNGSNSSTTIPAIDMLSNGFKCRVLNDEVNTTADYIYMAFAEEPLVGDNPATAR